MKKEWTSLTRCRVNKDIVYPGPPGSPYQLLGPILVLKGHHLKTTVGPHSIWLLESQIITNHAQKIPSSHCGHRSQYKFKTEFGSGWWCFAPWKNLFLKIWNLPLSCTLDPLSVLPGQSRMMPPCLLSQCIWKIPTNAFGKYQLVLVDYGYKEQPMEVTGQIINLSKKGII